MNKPLMARARLRRLAAFNRTVGLASCRRSRTELSCLRGHTGRDDDKKRPSYFPPTRQDLTAAKTPRSTLELGNCAEPNEILSPALALAAVNVLLSTCRTLLCHHGSRCPGPCIEESVLVIKSLGSAHSTVSRMDFRCHLQHGLQEDDSRTS